MAENFWDFAGNSGRKRPKANPAPKSSGGGAGGPFSVSQLTALIGGALKDCLPPSVAVRGEVSNFKLHTGSGHLYFTLKDADACIDCVMFRGEAAQLKFRPGDGLELIATGRVGVFAQRGRYQLYVSTLQPVGQGALELARKQIEAKLRGEGLFDPERKRPIPRYPRRIALVTSTQTAAIQDMLKVLRRFPFVQVLAYHVPVQGEGSAEKIAAALLDLSRKHREIGGVDVILLGRGGGSLEDLWEFNEEIVARAIVACEIPVITGIGHEIDVSIADLVADYHAHTPTEAAQVAARHWRAASELIDGAAQGLRRELRSALQDARHRLQAIERHEVFRRPLDWINVLRQGVDDHEESLAEAMGQRLKRGLERIMRLESRLRERHPRHALRLEKQRLDSLGQRLGRASMQLLEKRRLELGAVMARLECVNPQTVLKRGYSITTVKKTGTIVKDPAQVRPGDTIITRTSGGEVESVVEDARQLKLFE